MCVGVGWEVVRFANLVMAARRGSKRGGGDLSFSNHDNINKGPAGYINNNYF